MSHTHLRRTVVIATEITALVAAMLTSLITGPTSVASASPEQPVIATSIAAPTGITIDSPWVTDATGASAWALGVTSSGTGVLAKRDLATSVITTTPTVAGEIGATEGRVNPSTGTITFLAKRQGTGRRVVVINPSTGARVWTYDLPATDTNPRGIGFHSGGTAVYLGSNIATSQVVKLTSATGALSSSVNLATSPITAGFSVGTKMLTLAGTTAPKLIVFKDAPPMMLETTTALTGLTQPLVDPVVVGNTVWLGTETGQARLVGVDFVAKTVVANFPLANDESGLRNLAIPAGSAFAYGTTVAYGHTRLVSIRLSDGVKVGSVDLGAITGATSVTVSGRYVDVAFPGAVSIIRLTTAAAPTAPNGLSVVESDKTLAVSWMPSVSAEPLVTYVLSASSGGVTKTCETTVTTCSLGGLTNGAVYDISVTATTYAGSATSATITGSPATVPDTPVGLTGIRGNSTVAFAWEAPAQSGGRPITGYTVTVQPGGATCSTATTACAVGGLLNGTDYTAAVVAHSVVGDSAASESSSPATPATIPNAPKDLITVRGANRVDLSWSAPLDNGGDAISGYDVHDADGTVVCTTTHTDCTIAGLPNGTPVSFTVVATNAVGQSDSSSASVPVTPATVPDAPSGVSVNDAVGGAALTWEAPLDGGDAITRYLVTLWSDADAVRELYISELAATIDGIEYPNTYRITVEAINSVGSSERATVWAMPIAPPPPPVVEPPIIDPPVVEPPVVEPPVIPSATIPMSPTRLVLRSVTKTRYSLEWVAPNNGGAAIIDYRIARRISGTPRFTPIKDGVSTRRTVRIPRPANGKAVYVRITSVNEVGESAPATVVMLKGKRLYEMRSVRAVRLSEAAAFAGSFARSTPYDGTSFVNVVAHSDFL